MTFGYHGPAFGTDQVGEAGRLAALGLGLGDLPQELRQNRGLAVLNVFGGGVRGRRLLVDAADLDIR